MHSTLLLSMLLFSIYIYSVDYVNSDTDVSKSPANGLNIHDYDSFKAIRTLHTKMDVDADGEIDDLESKKFLESDKSRASSVNNAHKLRYLHQDGRDRSITVDELWEAWKNSQVYNWTVDETVFWLVNHVELPDYSRIFEENAINGTILPRLATDSQFVYKLGITEPSAKSKISIKAMDVVLFGPPKFGSHSKARDVIVSLIIVIAISACYVFYSRSRASQLALQAMKDNLDSIQKAEDQISELQKELDKSLKAQEAVVSEKRNLEHQLEMQRQFSASNLCDNNKSSTGKSKEDGVQEKGSDTVKLEEEVQDLRKELQETYDAMAAKKFRAPFKLRSLLKSTYDIESQYYNEKKLSLESKAKEVKLRNQKLQKKKTSFLGYYKIAQENSLEEDLNTIVEVKEAFQRITRDIKDRNERWREIEILCGCQLDLAPSIKPTSC